MSENVHIIPINDSKQHTSHPSCPCSPYQGEDPHVWIHNAWDGREFYEEPDKDEIELLRRGIEDEKQGQFRVIWHGTNDRKWPW